jgi:hypothetical protein
MCPMKQNKERRPDFCCRQCIAEYAFSGVFHRIHSEVNFLVNPNSYTVWLGYGWLSVSGLSFGPALQMKGLWESDINVCFPFMYSQIYYFQNTIIVFCLPVPTLIYLVWDLYISRIGLPILQEICGPMLGIYKLLTQTHECWNWDWGRTIPRKGIH